MLKAQGLTKDAETFVYHLYILLVLINLDYFFEKSNIFYIII